MVEKKLLVICGPTATGKTRLGIEMAKKFGGEIVSADSRQVYRGMDIGTGKDLPIPIISNIKYQISKTKLKTKNFQIGHYLIEKIPLWLLDIVCPDYKFNVSDYKKCADLVIKDILNRGKLPIIVGGTGFYIKAVVDGIGTMGVEPDWELRDKLQSCKVSELQRLLERTCPERMRGMNGSDRQNPRRLIRAIEVARNFKVQPFDYAQGKSAKFDTLFIGLTAPNEILYQKIDRRVDDRVKAGLENETSGLLKKGYNWDNSVLGTTLAYKEWGDYFAEKATKEQTIQKWKFDEHNYARRQMTWFKKIKNINWFDMTEDNLYGKVEKLTKSWYS